MNHEPHDAPAAPFESPYGHERWQAPSFAASWISPPAPRRSAADENAAPRDDDHA